MSLRSGNPTLLALAILVAIAGATFTLQGVGVPIGHSFMIGDLRWTAIGLAMLAAAAAVVLIQLRRS
jgi:ABC-type anion transport system duplicated permease subunit